MSKGFIHDPEVVANCFSGEDQLGTNFVTRNHPPKLGAEIGFERIRRVTGYLVGDKNKRFNNAKLAEECDRVKHEEPTAYI